MRLDLEVLGIASGVFFVIVIFVRGIRRRQYPGLRTVLVVFFAGAGLPIAIVLILNLLTGRPAIEPSEYKLYTAAGAIGILWLAGKEILSEFQSIDSDRD